MAVELNQIYKCSVCGNIVQVLHVGGGTLACCDKQMQLLTENTTDAAIEKHVPVIEKTEKGIKVTVGKVAHPMEEEHYIEWIEMSVDGRVGRKYLKPGDKPEAEFCTKSDQYSIRAYCNLHGLWKSKK